MSYTKSNMYYDDYKWSARADHDNPKIIGGTDHAQLNREEGYEMLYFINSLAKTWNWKNPSIGSFQKLEKIIRKEVPSSIRTHSGIKTWIAQNYKTI
ncbi:hypothetical protein ESA94_18240 [Lacibacter luteus]|uniref:Uncharacterized protein n=1 Tax=Lacibacter luteus TaxID=2508719 RepID=A0A4Q1CFX4_9BACT|nr:hypothetical protein [Lacibacter luteus]RXK58572.1 hypothetical protein ESA94_18240 [Lacibacter luteus]